MVIGTVQVYLAAEWVYSLKEKRTVVKSLTEKIKHKFNVAVAEVAHQDVHQTIVIGIACVTNDSAHANSMIDHVVRFIEQNTDAVVTDVVMEIF